MLLERIFTDRHFQTWPSWQIVYEWEDEIAEALQLPLVNSPTLNMIHHKINGLDNRLYKGKFNTALNTINPIKPAYQKLKGSSLYFEMAPRFYDSFSNGTNTIPILIDFWDKKNVSKIVERYNKCQQILVTSLEVLQFLALYISEEKLIHFPMSLPTKHRLNADFEVEKKYDIVLSGRTNPVLAEYIKEFVSTHKDVEYLVQVERGGKLYYESNKRGVIGEFNSREAYLALMSAAKVSFYSTPGIDGGEHRTAGFNPVTPRFFELLTSACHVIARYPDTVETRFFEMNSICPSANNYDTFNLQLTKALNSPIPVYKNSQYMSAHYTANRIDILKNIQ